MTIYSWNVNGLRAIIKKGFLDGYAGLVIAFSHMATNFYKYIKLSLILSKTLYISMVINILEVILRK